MLVGMTASPKPAPRKPNPAAELAGSIAARLDRPVVLVGLMGSGKSAVGRRTAKQLGIGFKDSDQLIVKAAGNRPAPSHTDATKTENAERGRFNSAKREHVRREFDRRKISGLFWQRFIRNNLVNGNGWGRDLPI